MPDKIRILVYGLTANKGGVESFILNYVKNIPCVKLRFDFICSYQTPVYYKDISGISENIFIVPGRRKYFAYRKNMKTILSENHYDIVWCNQCSLSDILVLKLAKKAGVRCGIMHAHNSKVMSKIPVDIILHYINKYVIKKYANRFFACSRAAAQFFYTGDIIDSPRFKIINNAIDTEKFVFNESIRNEKRKELGIQNKFVIGNIGRFHFQKNHEFLVRVFYEIQRQREDAVLLLVGSGALERKIVRMAESLGLKSKIIFLGQRDDISDMLSSMDVFVLPSRFEGLPMVLVEAQASSVKSFVSTAITRESAINETVAFIDLKKGPLFWAKMILDGDTNTRYDRSLEMKNACYDIKTEALKLEKIFLQLTV
jgi:glycosyltransferase involved in cell wall biosynthesis